FLEEAEVAMQQGETVTTNPVATSSGAVTAQSPQVQSSLGLPTSNSEVGVETSTSTTTSTSTSSNNLTENQEPKGAAALRNNENTTTQQTTLAPSNQLEREFVERWKCPICFEPQATPVNVNWRCNHTACRHCAAQWVAAKHPKKPTCPVCRV